MASKTSIKVDLDEHTLGRLIERQPNFMKFTPDDSIDIINLLNENYNHGTLHRKYRRLRRRHKFSRHVLQVPNLYGVFYLKGYSKLPNTYITSTFKLLRYIAKSIVKSRKVEVEYSFNIYESK